MKGIDVISGAEAPLFHPRKHTWKEHFIWSVDRLNIISQSLIGMVTVDTLELNRERILGNP